MDLLFAPVKLDILEMAKLAGVCYFFLVAFSCLFVCFVFIARAFFQSSCSSLHTYVVNCFVKIMVEHADNPLGHIRFITPFK